MELFHGNLIQPFQRCCYYSTEATKQGRDLNTEILDSWATPGSLRRPSHEMFVKFCPLKDGAVWIISVAYYECSTLSALLEGLLHEGWVERRSSPHAVYTS